MFFRQFVHSDLGCAAYMVASGRTGECIVVDPRWEIEDYLETAADHGFHITTMVETHTHADHVSGHGRLAEATGATICIHDAAGVAYPHRALVDGDVLTIGDDVRIHVLHTPGHRPEHIALAVQDVSRGDDPWLLLSGDSLFVGDVARPDLAVDGQEGARLLYSSLHEKLLTLPDFVGVYPAHVAGSLCGRVSSEVMSTTLGYEKRYNPALAIESETEFVRHMNEDLPQRPPNMRRIVEVNRGPLKTGAPTPPSLSPEDVEQRLAVEAVLLDVRPAACYLSAHVPGSIHVSVSGPQFGMRAGFVLLAGTPIVILASDKAEAMKAVTALQVVAFDEVCGAITIDEWLSSGRPTVSIDSLNAAALHERLSEGSIGALVDVREPREWAEGTVPNARRVPYRELAARVPELDRPVAVMCESGGRSAIAASLLERAGYSDVLDVENGMSGWREAGFEVAHLDGAS